jgi:hypothetical protein
MPTETYIDRARRRVRAEQEAVDAKLDAFDSFIERVEDVSTEQTSPPSLGVRAAVGAKLQWGTSGTERCREVRTAFAETVQPHSTADVDDSEPETLLETMSHELSEAISVALAPTTETSFTTDIQRAILTETDSRRTETTALRRALDREEAIVEDAAETVDTMTAWIVDTNETPLSEFDFETLQDHHETLATYRERCGELCRERQEFLQGTTSQDAEAGVRHQSLIPYLYQSFSIEYPVLVTAVRLDSTCAECQRALRDHLVRRV